MDPEYTVSLSRMVVARLTLRRDMGSSSARSCVEDPLCTTVSKSMTGTASESEGKRKEMVSQLLVRNIFKRAQAACAKNEGE